MKNRNLVLLYFFSLSHLSYGSVEDQKRIFLGVFFTTLIFVIIYVVKFINQKKDEYKHTKLGGKNTSKIERQITKISNRKQELKTLLSNKVITKDEYDIKKAVLNHESKESWIELALNKREDYKSILKAHKKGLISNQEKEEKVNTIKRLIQDKSFKK